MDIKRVNSGMPPQSVDEAGAPKNSNFEKAATAAATGKAGEPLGPGGLLGAPCKRSDLTSNRFDEILQKSIDTLLDRNAAANGPLPPGTREQIAKMLAADPFFAKRVFHLLDQEAAKAEGR